MEIQGPHRSRRRAFEDYFDAELESSWTDATLFLCCFITGLLDAAVFNVWSCFVSMQTGNTLYIGLGVSGQPKDQPYRWIKSGVAVISFLIGSFLFSRLQSRLGPFNRSALVLSASVQAILTIISAILVTVGIVPINAGQLLPDNLIVILPICLLSLQSAGQMVMSRLMGFSELTTVVLTSAYCDLMCDEKVLTAAPTRNVKRNRRIGSMIIMITGAIAGGYVTLDGDIHQALWIAGGLKVAVVIIWASWKSKQGVRLE